MTGGIIRSPVPVTFYHVEEQDSDFFVVFSAKFPLVKLIFLVDIVLWRMDIVLFSKLRYVCIVVWLVFWLDVGICVCGIRIKVAVLIFGIEAASRIGVVVGRRVDGRLTPSHCNLTYRGEVW